MECTYLQNYTNIKINNKLIIADIYELGEENIKYGMYIFTDIIIPLLEPLMKLLKNQEKERFRIK